MKPEEKLIAACKQAIEEHRQHYVLWEIIDAVAEYEAAVKPPAMKWKNSEPPTDEALLVKFSLNGGDEYHVCRVDDSGYYVTIEHGDDLGFDISADFDWILLDDILPNIARCEDETP